MEGTATIGVIPSAECALAGLAPGECGIRTPVRIADDGDTVFAYQFGAGIGYDITQNITAGVDYRYFATAEPTFRTVNGTKFHAEYETHNVSLSLRYKF